MDKLIRDPSLVTSLDGLVQYARSGLRDVYGAGCDIYVRGIDSPHPHKLGGASDDADAATVQYALFFTFFSFLLLIYFFRESFSSQQTVSSSNDTLLAAPGLVGGAVEIVLLARRSSPFTPGEISVIASFATVVGITHRQVVRLTLVNSVTESLLSEIDLTMLLVKALRAGGQLVQAERCALFLHDENTNELYARVFDEKPVRILDIYVEKAVNVLEK